ncbi:MAG: DUF1295 domain-containing protein [Saprospiraceae bacterium]
MYNLYLDAATLVFWFMVIWFFVAQLKGDNSIVDVAWGLGFVVVAWWMHRFYYLPTLLLWMVAIWGLRLAWHILKRNLKTGEDWRYRKWREEWGKWAFIRSFFQVFMLQGIFMWVVALPIMQDAKAGDQSGLGLFQWLGFLLWLIGFLWEAIGDWQLARFKSNPQNKGKIMTTGLWKLSRHPNYFGEMVLWWGIFIFTIPHGAWWLGLLGPLTVTWLLNRVSGVPMLEKKYEENAAYQAYVKSTNALLPDFSKLF